MGGPESDKKKNEIFQKKQARFLGLGKLSWLTNFEKGLKHAVQKKRGASRGEKWGGKNGSVFLKTVEKERSVNKKPS